MTPEDEAAVQAEVYRRLSGLIDDTVEDLIADGRIADVGRNEDGERLLGTAEIVLDGQARARARSMIHDS